MADRDLESVIDMIESGTRIQAYLKDRTRDDVAGDLALGDAVLYRFTVLGEAAKRLSREFRASHPEFDWSDRAGFRDHIVHEYDNVNWDKVWEIANNDLPDLLAKLRLLAPKESD